MKILIANDDGIAAQGLCALARAFARAGHEVAVVAPDGQRSAASHSMTLSWPLIPKRAQVEGAVAAWALNGTPVDCVKLGLDSLFPQAEAVVSGINHGYNAGTDVLYSGTVGAAMEGALNGLPAMAVSLAPERTDTFDRAAELAVRMLEVMSAHPLPPNTVLNLNYPACDEALGVKAVPLKFVHYTDMYEGREHERVGKYYWLSGVLDSAQEYGEDDYSYLRRGYATVTVVTADVTDREATGRLAQLL